jgi:hypothetical protein
MELLNVLKAQSVWLFDTNDLNPRGRNFLPEMLEWLKDRYEFQTAPASVTDLDDTKGLAFKRGSFSLGGDTLVVELTLYNDGVIANTFASTNATDLFLEDVFSESAVEFDLKPVVDEIVRVKAYLSELTVRMKPVFPKLNPKLAALASRLSAMKGTVFEPGGISFWADTSATAQKPSAFSIERKLHAPFGENRFYSRAPIQTDQHLELLKEFEEAFDEKPAPAAWETPAQKIIS